MSLKKMIRKLMNELKEAVEEVNFAQLKLKKVEHNAKRVFEKLKDMKNMIRKLMNKLGEAIEEVNLTQLKLKKVEHNAKRVFKKLKDMKVLPISDMEEAQFILYLQTELGFAGKGKLSSKLPVEARGELVRFAALHQLPLVTN
nr:hypothetical protein CFP56_68227 [Quercus suber]